MFNDKKMAILVVSCDKYCDTWDPFFNLYFKYWNDCKYKIYLGTNEMDYRYSRVNIIKVGYDKSWADNFRSMLDNIKEEYVLFLLDDFFLCKKVDNIQIERCFEIAKREDVKCMKLHLKQGTKIFDKYNMKLIKYSEEYCINTGIAIWEKNTLYSLLKDGYSAWEFELKNSNNCLKNGSLPGLFVALKKPAFKVKNGVIQGKWVPSSVNFVQKQGITIDTSQRIILSCFNESYETLKFSIKKILPKPIYRVVKTIMIKIGLRKFFVSSRYS